MIPVETVPLSMERKSLQANHLLYQIETAMWLQQSIIELGDTVLLGKRLQLLLIFLKNAFSIAFNAYNLTSFVVNFISKKSSQDFTIQQGLIFYGHTIASAWIDILVTIIGFACTFDMIQKTARIANKLGIYVHDEVLKLRLLQFSFLSDTNLRQYTIYGLYALNGSFISSLMAGTITYIILFLQYGSS